MGDDQQANNYKLRNAEIYRRMRAGDAAAADELAEANLPLVIGIVDAYLVEFDRHRRHRDDLIGEGNRELLEAARSLAKRNISESSIGGYLGKAVERAVKKCAGESALVGPSQSTIKRERAKKSGRTFAHESLCDPDRLNGQRFGVSVPELNHGVELLRSVIESCCTDALDLAIVRMREEGYNDREIAERNGLSANTIQRRRALIEARFDATGFMASA
jgi:hypothetical protein